MIFAKSNVMRMHLAKLLVREGLVNVDQIREAIERQRELKYGLCESLSDLGFISESSLIEFLGKQYGVPVMYIDDHEIDRDVIRLIPNETARDKYLIPVEVSGSDLTVAMSDPSNILLLDDLGFLTGKNIRPVVASERSIKAKLEKYYSSDEADSPTEENPTQSRSRNLSANLSMGDQNKRPIDEIINELEQYSNKHISPNDVTRDEKQSAGPRVGDGFNYREEDKDISDEPAPGGNETDVGDNEFDLVNYSDEQTAPGVSDYESDPYPLRTTDCFEGASSIDEHRFGEAGSVPDYSESRGELEILESSNNDEENNLESGEYDSGPLLMPDSEKERQLPVAEEPAVDFDERMPDKDAERVTGFDFASDKGETPLESYEYRSDFNPGVETSERADFAKSQEEVVPSSHAGEESDTPAIRDEHEDESNKQYAVEEHTLNDDVNIPGCTDMAKSVKGPIEYGLKESDNFASENKNAGKNKEMTNHSVFNSYQFEGASGEVDRFASAVTVEKRKEDSAEEWTLQNNTHDFRSSLHREKETGDGFSESEDSAHEEHEMFAPELNATSSDAEFAKKADGVSYRDEEKESNTEGLDYFKTESEKTGPEEANFSPRIEDDTQKGIDAAEMGTQSDIRHEDNDELFEEEETVTNSSESIGGDAYGKQSRGSVLIVDDSLTVQKIVSIALKREGYTVYTAGDGMQALSRLNEVIPDLILVDVNMPHMDGYQLCKIIKSHGLTNKIPVVMLTGKTRILDKMKWKRAGATDSIAKPFDSASLVEAAAKCTN